MRSEPKLQMAFERARLQACGGNDGNGRGTPTHLEHQLISRFVLLPRILVLIAVFAVCWCVVTPALSAQQPVTASTSDSASTTQPGMMMLTIFLRHDESKTLDEINAHLKQTGFTSNFPPPGTEVVSWYVMMGIGQVVTLRFPAEKLREVNLAIEHGAWGAFHTEFYPTYDYKQIWEAERQGNKTGSR